MVSNNIVWKTERFIHKIERFRQKNSIEWKKKKNKRVEHNDIRFDSVVAVQTKCRTLRNVHFISIHSHSSHKLIV